MRDTMRLEREKGKKERENVVSLLLSLSRSQRRVPVLRGRFDSRYYNRDKNLRTREFSSICVLLEKRTDVSIVLNINDQSIRLAAH